MGTTDRENKCIKPDARQTLKQREVTVDAKRGKGSKDLLHEIASSSLCAKILEEVPSLEG
jgi:hypothetical protein